MNNSIIHNKGFVFVLRVSFSSKPNLPIPFATFAESDSYLSKFKSDFPKLNESTITPWVKKYKSELSSKKPRTNFTIAIKKGRPTRLSEELDQKLRAMIINLRTAGAVINIHVVRGVLAGNVRSNLEIFGQFPDFEMTGSWVHSLYHCINFYRRAATTSRPIITRS